MPPRFTSISANGAFNPPNDATTYRDLLLFEERLKKNAAIFNRRKRRYQLFLVQLLLIIAFLLSEVLLQTDFLSVPWTWFLHKTLPDIYGQEAYVQVHPYFALGLLCVAATTLILFFLSGMYAEKIAWANKYVPHANRSLRNLNMYLNVRQPPLRSKPPFSFFSFLFPRTSPSSPPLTRTPDGRRRSPSPIRISKRSSSVPIPTIPPSSNPRGELIFSSRVDRSFRDSYERYRNNFEKKRRERERAEYEATWVGWFHTRCMTLLRLNKTDSPSSTAPLSGTVTPAGMSRTVSVIKGKGSRASTPSSSRRSSPVPVRTPRRNSLLGTGSRKDTSSSAEGLTKSMLPDIPDEKALDLES